jgi:hypothetical protein
LRISNFASPYVVRVRHLNLHPVARLVYNERMRRIDELRARRNASRASFRPAAARQRPGQFETLGLIVVVLLILAITITRSWHHIHWSLR